MTRRGLAWQHAPLTLLLLACSCQTETIERRADGAARSGDAAEIPAPAPAPTETRVAEAISEARAALAADIGSGARWGELGAVFDAHSYFPEAERCYRRALLLEPGEFRWSYHLAVTLDREAGEVEEILQLFRSFEAVQPNYPTVHYRLGATLARDGRTLEARAAFERALQLDPALAIAHRQLGRLLMTEGDLDAAIARLERAVELDPSDGAARSALAQAHARGGRSELARASAEAAKGLEPVLAPPDPLRIEIANLGVSALMAFKRGQAALEAGRVEEALELFAIKLEVNPSAATHYYIGLAHLQAARPDRAAGHFREALTLGEHPDSHWQLAEILLEKGDTAAGLGQLRKARATGSDDAELLHGVAVAFARAGELREAVESFERAGRLDARSASLRADWCGALLALERVDDAVERCSEAVSLDESSARAHFHLGLALESSARTERALLHYEAAVRLDPDSRARERLRELKGGGS